MTPAQPLHATAVAQWAPGAGWRAILISGPSGAGKSDLALQLIGRGWRLVADDSVHVFASGEALYAVAPETIAGRIEVRGVGITGAGALGVARLEDQGALELLLRFTDTVRDEELASP